MSNLIISWMDLPSLPTIESYFHGNIPSSLKKKIQIYEMMVQDDHFDIESRIVLLEEISQYLDATLASLPPNSPDLSLYHNLLSITVGKKNYFYELTALKDKDTIEERFGNYFNPSYSLNDNILITLNNSTYFDMEKRELWGKYWVETIDPCHRPLTPWYEKWLKERNQESCASFFFWLEKQLIPSNLMRIDYIDDLNLHAYELRQEDGKIITFSQSTGRHDWLTTNPEKEYVFIIDTYKKIYLIEASSVIRHTSLSHGKPILGAGSIQAYQGNLTQLILGSGHYLPNIAENQQTLRILLEKGIQINTDMEISYYFKFKRIGCLVREFLYYSKQQYKNKSSLKCNI